MTKPDFYNSKDECMHAMKNKVQTNPRYKNFKQDIYTAGDVEQFTENLDSSCFNLKRIIIDKRENVFEEEGSVFHQFWSGYEELDGSHLYNTFKYMFYKFKKGIYVKIMDNKVKVFLPFSKVHFQNEWHQQIKFDPSKFNSIEDFLQYVCEMEKRKFNPRNVNKFVNSWYGNNSLVRYEYPVTENDTNVNVLKNMLEELCKTRKVPDIEFFINRRDFPILKKDKTEPYNHIWNSSIKPLISHNYEKYLPILSMSSTDKFADILFPTAEDWARIQNKELGIYFPCLCKDFVYDFSTLWKNKHEKAVFRGSSTGTGTTIETNMRLKVASMNKAFSTYLDAGITKWNLRPRKIEGKQYLQTIDIKSLNFDLVSKLSPEEQSNYKYILHIDGHVSAFRLSLELSMGSVILKVASEYNVWYSALLKPYVHFIPIKNDLSDLIDQIKWCKEHDKECERIAQNCLEFYQKYLNKKGVLDYMQKLLVDMKGHTGFYVNNNTKSCTTYQNEEEQRFLDSLVVNVPNHINHKTFTFPIHTDTRYFYFLKAVQHIITALMKSEKMNTYMNDSCCTEIIRNGNRSIKEFKIQNMTFVVKAPLKISDGHVDTTHEAFIGLKAINQLLHSMPNFLFTYGITKDHLLITEKIEGLSLFQFIQSKSFSMKILLEIIIQISLALQVAQNSCCFMHNDLAPWNIILKEVGDTSVVEYLLSQDNVSTVSTNVIPIIIDYGKSHISLDQHFGNVNLYKLSSCQDIVMLLITTVTQILKYQTLNSTDFKLLLTLINFISNTSYCPEKFTNKRQLQQFLHNAHKFDNLLNSDKSQLNNLTPYDLVTYINKYFKSTCSFKITKNRSNSPTTLFLQNINKSFYFKPIEAHINQMVELMFSLDDLSKQMSFQNFINSMKEILFSDIPENRLEALYLLQIMNEELRSIQIELENFFCYSAPGKRFLFTHLIEAIKEIEKYIHVILESMDYSSFKVVVPSLTHCSTTLKNFDESVFIKPKVICEYLLSRKECECCTVLYFKHVLNNILTNSTEDSNKFTLKKKFSNLLNKCNKDLIMCFINYRTLQTVSKDIYSKHMFEDNSSSSSSSSSFYSAVETILQITQ